MNSEQYIELFIELAFYCQDRHGQTQTIDTAYQSGRKMRHRRRRDLPSIYFNGNSQGVYFTVMVSPSDQYPVYLWDMFRPIEESEDGYMDLTPREGMERIAFEHFINASDPS